MPPRGRGRGRGRERGTGSTLGDGSSVPAGTSQHAAADIHENEDGEPFITEGDEEAMYVFLDLSELSNNIPLAGPVRLQGMDTDKPEIRLPNGELLEGEYSNTLGSQLFFEVKVPPRSGGSPTEEPRLAFRGLSEKTVKFFNKPVPGPAKDRPPPARQEEEECHDRRLS